VFQKILNTFGTKSLSAVINLLTAILLSQFLGPGGKGQQGLIITTITFILVFSNLVGGATLVFLAPRKPSSQLLLPSYLWTLLISLVSFPILWFFNLLDSQFILHACILSALSSFTAIHTSLLIGKEKIAASNFIGLIQPVMIILSLAFFFVIKGWHDIGAYILALYISFGASMVVSFYYVISIAGPLAPASFKDMLQVSGEMLKFGALNQVAHITQILSFRMSFYVLDSYHGESAVGVYSNGISLAESVWLIAKSISLVQYARISNSDDREYSQKLTMQLIRASVTLSLIALIPLLLLPGKFYLYIFGNGFEGVKEVIWSLSAGVVIYNISILLGHYFSGTGRYQINAIASSLGLVVSAVLFFTLIPTYGITGAGYATSISYLFTTIILLVFFRRDNPQNFRKLLTETESIKKLRMDLPGMMMRKHKSDG
jgi:O-antigen/teichoic acid export membrane protein